MGEDPAMTSAVPNAVPQEPPRAPTPRAPGARVAACRRSRPGSRPPGVRARLARLGGTRHPNRAPMLEPLFRVVRATHPKADLGMIERAYRTAEQYHRGQLRKSGDPYITHPLAVATILAELGMTRADAVRRAAARHRRGHAVHARGADARLRRRDRHARRRRHQARQGQVRRVRRRPRPSARWSSRWPRTSGCWSSSSPTGCTTCARSRYLRPEKQERIARETLEIYAPLAHRLGMNTIKWELEDLVVRDPAPEGVRRDRPAGRRARARPATSTSPGSSTRCTSDLRGAKIKATVTGRPKHYYSIYQKMIVRGREFADIYDLVGIRVLVDSVRDCYAALGVIHARWNPVPGRFKDYIAMPKFNMYQSLHTTVIGPQGKPVELQIRTFAMHRRAEYGVAAHWKYKEDPTRRAGRGRRADHRDGGPNDMAWLRQLRRLAARDRGPGGVPRLAAVRDQLHRGLRLHPARRRDRRCRRARRRSTSRTRSTPRSGTAASAPGSTAGWCRWRSTLENGDVVEVFTSKAQGAGPSRDWLTFVKSPRARNKIRHWFTKERREEAIEQGKDAIARQLRKEGLPLQRLLSHETLTAVANDLRYPDVTGAVRRGRRGHTSAHRPSYGG